MANLLLLIACFALGAAARRWSTLPPESPRVLNTWILNVSLPAMVLEVVHGAPLAWPVLLAASSLWLVFLLPMGLAWWAVQRRLLPAPLAGGLALAVGLGNTSFVGFPILEVLGGKTALGTAAITDQLGTFLLVALVATPFALKLGGGHASWRAMARRLVTFPPFLALLVAVGTRAWPLPPLVLEVTGRLGPMMTPLALASVGWQFDVSTLKGQGRWLAVGLLARLVVAPGLALLFLGLVRGGVGPVEQVAVAECAMPTAVMASVLATEHHLEPRLVSALVALGVPLAFVSVPAWWWVCGWWVR